MRRRRYNPGYDTELPEQARLELDRPRRPRILGRKTKSTLKQSPKWPLYLALLITIVVVGGTIATWRQEPTAERTNKAISQLLAPQPMPTTAPAPLSVRPGVWGGRNWPTIGPRHGLASYNVPRALHWSSIPCQGLSWQRCPRTGHRCSLAASIWPRCRKLSG